MGNSKKKILIIEDDPAISVMYKGKFESEGFEVLVADNGADGLELAKNNKPSIVMLDIILPRMDGFAVLEELKKDSDTKGVPIILLTNLSTDEDKKKGEKMGAVDYVVKANLTPAQVSEKIKKLI